MNKVWNNTYMIKACDKGTSKAGSSAWNGVYGTSKNEESKAVSYQWNNMYPVALCG